MVLTSRAPASSSCPGSGKEPEKFYVEPQTAWTYCPICTRVFNVTRAGLIPRHRAWVAARSGR
jgi:uncharacterized protein YcgI (DUF1989 family)